MSDPVAYRLEGHVRFDNLESLRREGERAIEAGGERAVIDLSGLVHGNSATVALLMAWLRGADRLDKQVVFQGAPKEVTNIIELSGMTDLLPMAGAEPPAAAESA